MKKPKKEIKPIKPTKPKLPKRVKVRSSSDEEFNYFANLALSEDDEEDRDKIAQIMSDVESELRRAASLHGPMKSLHEGYAVILEEMDELWDQVKLKAKLRNPDNIREEAIQISAMAARLVVDLL